MGGNQITIASGDVISQQLDVGRVAASGLRANIETYKSSREYEIDTRHRYRADRRFLRVPIKSDVCTDAGALNETSE